MVYQLISWLFGFIGVKVFGFPQWIVYVLHHLLVSFTPVLSHPREVRETLINAHPQTSRTTSPCMIFNNATSLPLLLLQALGKIGTLKSLVGEGEDMDEVLARGKVSFLRDV